MDFDQRVLSDYCDSPPLNEDKVRAHCAAELGKKEGGVGRPRIRPNASFVCGKYHFIREGCVEPRAAAVRKWSRLLFQKEQSSVPRPLLQGLGLLLLEAR